MLTAKVLQDDNNTNILCRAVDKDTVDSDIAMLKIQGETKLMLDKLYCTALST